MLARLLLGVALPHLPPCPSRCCGNVLVFPASMHGAIHVRFSLTTASPTPSASVLILVWSTPSLVPVLVHSLSTSCAILQSCLHLVLSCTLILLAPWSTAILTSSVTTVAWSMPALGFRDYLLAMVRLRRWQSVLWRPRWLTCLLLWALPITSSRSLLLPTRALPSCPNISRTSLLSPKCATGPPPRTRRSRMRMSSACGAHALLWRVPYLLMPTLGRLGTRGLFRLPTGS